VNKIQAFIHRPGHVLLNGYNNREIAQLKAEQVFQDFTIVYNGTLYETQPIEIFLTGMKLFWDRNPNLPVKLYFLGLAANPEQAERVKKLLIGYHHHVTITERVIRTEGLVIQQKAALALLVSHANVKGIPSSKLYEYIGLQKHILLCPNDNDIIEDTLTQYKHSSICDSPEAVFELILKMAEKHDPKAIHQIVSDKASEAFSRREHTKRLAYLLDQIKV
jgi:hypothetical protein